jgi:hypothetical protein
MKGGRYVSVPDSATPVDYDDLPELDPATLQDGVEPDEAWNVALAALAARVDVVEGGAASLPPSGAAEAVLAKVTTADGDVEWLPKYGGNLVLLLENAIA